MFDKPTFTYRTFVSNLCFSYGAEDERLFPRKQSVVAKILSFLPVEARCTLLA